MLQTVLGLDGVLEAIYAAYGIAWDEAAGADGRGRELEDEAIWLARALRHLLPDEPEIRGLLALMLLCKARGPARRTDDGRYVPLAEQDPRRWLELARHRVDGWSDGAPAERQGERRCAQHASRPPR
jgi:predicted RNA polymerase sigma factor